jgi:predicted MPP superfamily phosphohydrolase
MSSIGITSMNNTRSALPPRGNAPFASCTSSELLDLIGVGELSEGDSDVALSVAGRDESKVILLVAHQPGVSDEARGHSIDLQISGHVHGG